MHRMMLLLAVSAFLLSACITVDDFGTFWANATLDPAVEGSWETDASYSQRILHYMIIKQDKNYLIDSLEQKAKDPNHHPLVGRTFKTGKYNFFMAVGDHPNSGALMRYVLENGTLKLYDLNVHRMNDWLNNSHTEVDIQAHVCNGPCRMESIEFGKLDAKTTAFIDAIPNDANYWNQIDQLKKR